MGRRRVGPVTLAGGRRDPPPAIVQNPRMVVVLAVNLRGLGLRLGGPPGAAFPLDPAASTSAVARSTVAVAANARDGVRTVPP